MCQQFFVDFSVNILLATLNNLSTTLLTFVRLEIVKGSGDIFESQHIVLIIDCCCHKKESCFQMISSEQSVKVQKSQQQFSLP